MNSVFEGYENAFILKSSNYRLIIRDDIEQFLSKNEINSSEKIKRLIDCLERKMKTNKLFPWIDKQMFLVYGFFLNMVLSFMIDLDINPGAEILFTMALIIVVTNYETDDKYSIRQTEWDANIYAKEYLTREMTKVKKFSVYYFKLYNLKKQYRKKANKIEKARVKDIKINLVNRLP